MSGDLEIAPIQLTAEENLQSTVQPLNQRTIVRTGSLLTILSVAGLLNPPITGSSITKVHKFLSAIFIFFMSMSLGTGILLLLVGFFVVPRFPTVISSVATLVNAGFVLLKVVLGFGTSLVLMAVSSP